MLTSGLVYKNTSVPHYREALKSKRLKFNVLFDAQWDPKIGDHIEKDKLCCEINQKCFRLCMILLRNFVM